LFFIEFQFEIVYSLVVILFTFMSLSATFIFSGRNFHSRRIWYEKRAPENGVNLWRRFLEREIEQLRHDLSECVQSRHHLIVLCCIVLYYIVLYWLSDI